LQVQSGGSFDVDYIVEGPNGKIIMDGQKERQGDFVFSANVVGDYSFCFDNEMSTFAEKFVDFEIAVENESRAQLPSKQGTTPEQTSVLEESIFKVSGQLSTISRNQKYFRTRENRNFATVNSTEGRIINFSMIQIGLIICMGALQVFVVRFFFQVSLAILYTVGMSADCIIRVHERVTYKQFAVLDILRSIWVLRGVESKGRRDIGSVMYNQWKQRAWPALRVWHLGLT
jgi:hypothetical protein